MAVTIKDKLECAERELRFRHRVYNRLVVKGQMTRAEQDREIELMAAIVDDYRSAALFEEPEFQLHIETRSTIKERP